VARLPQVSSKRLISMLESLGYAIARRKSTKRTSAGDHHVTVPDHRTLAKGTLSDIPSAVSIRNTVARTELMKRLRS
jgi:predicted RNA binding protein YcfA (HicA-like mRNA interferase family)